MSLAVFGLGSGGLATFGLGTSGTTQTITSSGGGVTLVTFGLGGQALSTFGLGGGLPGSGPVVDPPTNGYLAAIEAWYPTSPLAAISPGGMWQEYAPAERPEGMFIEYDDHIESTSFTAKTRIEIHKTTIRFFSKVQADAFAGGQLVWKNFNHKNVDPHLVGGQVVGVLHGPRTLNETTDHDPMSAQRLHTDETTFTVWVSFPRQ